MFKPTLSTKTVAAIVLGNALEWYDFAVYSFIAIFIAKLFFPHVGSMNALLAATATFGVAFCMRPLGGILLGLYADKKGRKAAITLVMVLMTLSVLLMTLLPTYAQVGVIAPWLILFIRLLQGFSAGGAFCIATPILIELSPPDRRGYYASWQMVGQIMAFLLGALAGTLLTYFFKEQTIESWAWRIPFMVGLLIAPISFYLRKQLNEFFQPINTTQLTYAYFREQFKLHARQLFIAMGLVVGGTVATYLNLSYMPTYVVKNLNLPINTAFMALTISLVTMGICVPLFGILSDRIGRKPILTTAIALYLVTIYPLFYWLNMDPSFITLLIVQMICSLLLAAYFGVFAVIVAELFPSNIRSTALAFSYNLPIMIFGGFAQFIVTWLIKVTGSDLAITYYLMGGVAISLIAAISYREIKD